MLKRKHGNLISRPLLIQARNNFRYTYTAVSFRPFGHRHPDSVRVVNGESVQCNARRSIASHCLGVVGRSPLHDLHSKVGSHSVPIRCWEVDGARLKDGDIGKMFLYPHRWGKHTLSAGQGVPQEADMIGPLEREQLELPVEHPAVGLQRGVGDQLHLLVVDLLRPACTGHA